MIFFVSEVYVLSTHSCTSWKKKQNFFIIIVGVQEVIAYFTVGLNESYFNIRLNHVLKCVFLREQFVNEHIKDLLGEKSSNPVRNNPCKNFFFMIPFKINFLVKKWYCRNEDFGFAWDCIKAFQNCPFTTTSNICFLKDIHLCYWN